MHKQSPKILEIGYPELTSQTSKASSGIKKVTKRKEKRVKFKKKSLSNEREIVILLVMKKNKINDDPKNEL